MPDIDPHQLGLSVSTVLTRQPKHRSSLLWDAPSASKVCTCPKSYSIYVLQIFFLLCTCP